MNLFTKLYWQQKLWQDCMDVQDLSERQCYKITCTGSNSLNTSSIFPNIVLNCNNRSM